MIYDYKNIKIHFESSLDGDGRMFYPGFLKAIKEKIGNVNIAHEAFAGPAFIGFSLLEDKVCQNLTLSEIEPAAIDCCKKTIAENNLADRAVIYPSNCLEQVPPQKWDLVVGNPPHFSQCQTNLPQTALVTVDTDWDIHRRFYRDIGKYLNNGASILLVENGRGSSPQTFDSMITQSGLRIEDSFHCDVGRPSKHYFIWVKRKD